MLAKVIAWAPTRDEAARRLAATLRRARIHGLRTNRELLVEILGDAAFLAGEVSTDFLAERDLSTMQQRAMPGAATDQGLMLFAAAVAVTEAEAARRRVQRRIPNGWRNVVSAPQTTTFDVEGTEVKVGWHGGRDGYRLADVFDEVHGARTTRFETIDGGRRVVVEHGGISHPFEVHLAGDRVDVESVHGHLAATVVPRFTDPADQVATGSLLAPMPGSVVSIAVEAGQHVAAGSPVMVLEAMKMQHTVFAPHDGVVTDVPVTAGQQVASGAVLAVVQADNDQATDDAYGAAEGDSND
jgi:propionyl-CoA carboxylase alpha chain